MDLTQILIAIGAVLGTWVFNNYKLKDGVTDWFISKLSSNTYDISNHNVNTTLKALKFESKLTEFDNSLKKELYQFYIDIVIDSMQEMVIEILEKEKKLNFHNTKKLIKHTMYDKLEYINIHINRNINMPKELSVKFDKFRNYLTLQHTYAIEHALQAPNKKILLIQTFDAIENNSRWFLFYSTEMFETFNGHFDSLNRKNIFTT
jgi:hypothetical protein